MIAALIALVFGPGMAALYLALRDANRKCARIVCEVAPR